MPFQERGHEPFRLGKIFLRGIVLGIVKGQVVGRGGGIGLFGKDLLIEGPGLAVFSLLLIQGRNQHDHAQVIGVFRPDFLILGDGLVNRALGLLQAGEMVEDLGIVRVHVKGLFKHLPRLAHLLVHRVESGQQDLISHVAGALGNLLPASLNGLARFFVPQIQGHQLIEGRGEIGLDLQRLLEQGGAFLCLAFQ